jgi:acetyl-CoA C-acetyltransferase
MVSDNTPIIVGVGQFVELVDSPNYRGLSAVDLAAEAARNALNDALSVEKLAAHIDVVASTRTFNDSSPHLRMPFGASNNFPRSIGKRLGIEPQRAIWEDAGGNSPQDLVNEMSEALADGSAKMVLLAGAEAISTGRHLMAENKQVDWNENIEGSVDDRIGKARGLITDAELRHGLRAAPPLYGLCENARRKNLGLNRADYAKDMGKLFAPFTAVAATNPYSTTHKAYTSEQLTTVSERNRIIADPYTRLLVSRDQVNQSAAVVMTTVGFARTLGIPEKLWVYLHGYAKASERPLLERQDLGQSPAARMAANAALAAAGVGAKDIRFFDLYSCFPIAVSNVCDGLGVAVDDPRGLTLTGGLPYFGGPGNNYSMHGIASIVEQLRAHPGTFGFIGANGGFLSKYSVGIYSTKPTEFKKCDSKPLQEKINALPAPVITDRPNGKGTIETFTLIYGKDGKPATGVVIGRLQADNSRFIAVNQDGDTATLEKMAANDPLGASIEVTATEKANRFVLT